MTMLIIYSVLLLAGMVISQFLSVRLNENIVATITTVCLAYIMIEVGLEFTIDKRKIKSYGWDFVVAAAAATLPWVFCAIYFLVVLHIDWKEALFMGRFAAPTSAGVLFTMLAAAGLGATWLFRKAQTLAIFDDVYTILFLIPLQVLITGWTVQMLIMIPIIFALLVLAYRYMKMWRIPTEIPWIISYAIIIVVILRVLEQRANIHLEILLPSFVFGSILYNWKNGDPAKSSHAQHLERQDPIWHAIFDRCLKGTFMFFVGYSIPRVQLGDMPLGIVIAHILAITFVSNLGKCFPILCYRKEVSLRERIALSVAMFPRGEVGAGVILLAMGYGFGGIASTLAAMSLALNLILTGAFIVVVKKILDAPVAGSQRAP